MNLSIAPRPWQFVVTPIKVQKERQRADTFLLAKVSRMVASSSWDIIGEIFVIISFSCVPPRPWRLYPVGERRKWLCFDRSTKRQQLFFIGERAHLQFFRDCLRLSRGRSLKRHLCSSGEIARDNTPHSIVVLVKCRSFADWIVSCRRRSKVEAIVNMFVGLHLFSLSRDAPIVTNRFTGQSTAGSIANSSNNILAKYRPNPDSIHKAVHISVDRPIGQPLFPEPAPILPFASLHLSGLRYSGTSEAAGPKLNGHHTCKEYLTSSDPSWFDHQKEDGQF